MYQSVDDRDSLGGTADLRPRHGDLHPTPIGPIKPWSELTWQTKVFLSLSVFVLIGVLTLTIVSIVMKFDDTEDASEVTISIVQCIGMVFSIYYVLRGFLQENKQDLWIFIATVALLLIRAITTFAAISERNVFLIARFVVILVVCGLLIGGAIYMLCSPESVMFRVGGLLEGPQQQYFDVCMCISLLTFDLQFQWMLSVLVLRSGIFIISVLEKSLLAVGIIWASIKVIVGFESIRREWPRLLLFFVIMNIPELCYVFYLFSKLWSLWKVEASFALMLVTVACAVVSILVKGALLGYLYKAHANFGLGLPERIWNRSRRDDRGHLSASDPLSS